MPPTEVCVACGKTLEPAASFIREDGVRCAACNLRQDVADDQAKLAGREAEDLEESYSRRAKRLFRVHAVMWMTGAILIAAKYGEWFSLFILLALGLAVGLAARKPWAYYSALALDGVAFVGAVVCALTAAIEPAVAGFAAVCALFLLVLVYALRAAFVKPAGQR